MVLLSLLTLGMAAYGIAGCVSSAKTAHIERKIESRGNLDVEESFEDILRLHRINKTPYSLMTKMQKKSMCFQSLDIRTVWSIFTTNHLLQRQMHVNL